MTDWWQSDRPADKATDWYASDPITAPEKQPAPRGVFERAIGPLSPGFLGRLAGDVKESFMEGLHTTMAAPAQLYGEGDHATWAEVMPRINEKLRESGFSEQEAKRETDRLVRRYTHQEGMTNMIMGPVSMLASPVFGAYRTMVSRPLEEQTGFPKETTEGLTVAALGWAGLRASRPTARVRVNEAGEVSAQAIGTEPRAADFKTSAELIGGEAAPIDVYHGSPHAFEMWGIDPATGEKRAVVLTGEGATAYGHPLEGGYFAEAEATARGYMPPEGYLYKAKIHANREHFLDFDKPLSEQTEYARGKLAELGIESTEGQSLVNFLAERFGSSKNASVALRDAGIPGFKYLDQGSRGLVEKPTSNFVVFDDTRIEITHKNDVPIIEENLRRLWAEDGIHPAEAVNNAQRDAFLRQELRRPETDPATKLPAEAWSPENLTSKVQPHELYAPPDPLDLARTGELTANKAKEIGAKITTNQQEIENSIFGSKETADEWRKLNRQMNRAFDNADDAKAAGYRRQIDELEQKAQLTPRDEAYLNGEGWPEHSNPETWQTLRRDLQEVEGDRADAVTVVGYTLRRLPKADKPLADFERANLAVIQHAINEEVKRGGSPDAFLRDAFRKSGERYGGGADAAEIIAADMERLRGLMENPPPPRQALSSPPAEPAGEAPLRAVGAEVDRLHSAYETLKEEQGGVSTVYIGDLIERSGLSKEEVHAALMEAAQRGDASLHRTSTPFKDLSEARKEGGIDLKEPPPFDLPYTTVTLKEGAPRPLGAAVTETPPDLATQPAPSPGRVSAAVSQAGEKLFDMGRDIQMMVAPMATGTRESMAIAKDFANAMRRNRWEWSRIDDDIAKRFTPEQRKRMWDAADEESVARQLGESREHQGLVTLTADERAAVEDLQARAQTAWLKARDLGMVEGEGLPAYTPRMVMNIANATSEGGSRSLNALGLNLRTKTAQMRHRKHMTAEETEAAAKAVLGEGAEIARDIRTLPLATGKLEDAIAGRTLINNIKEYGKRTGDDVVAEGGIPAGSEHKWFTVDHPSFKTWRPKFKEVEGKVEVVKDAQGETVFEQVPIYVRSDFEGPLRAVLTQPSSAFYGLMMELKGKTMSMIMNSPLIHNAVEWGRALPGMPGKVATFKVYFEGNRAKNDVAVMREAIDNGLVPIGKRFFNQDITAVMEAPDLTPGRSLTSKILAAVPGLFDEGAGVAVKKAIDKAGDFWHNTLLWDRVADLQMGLYTNFHADLMAKGVDRQTASRVAAHWANRYAGALPMEAMSDGARKVANMLLFSRSFTLGNLGVMKDMLTGLPKDVIAQIERDGGFRPGAIAAAEPGIPAQVGAFTKGMARRKAMMIVGLDVALMYVGNSLLQNVMNVMVGDSTLEKELHGYAQRMQHALTEVREHPLKLIQPFRFFESLGATEENEPGKGERIRVGYAKDGTAIYARNPAGKIGEEFTGYLTGPLDMLRRKLGTIARPGWQILANDAGFGRKVYDPGADTPEKNMTNFYKVIAHIVKSQFPEGQITAASDLVKGEGDPKVTTLQAFGPIAGVTFSKGAPGGPAVGELYAARTQHQYAVDAALPDLRRQIQRGDIAGAQERMTELGIPPGLQRFYVRTSMDPSTRLSGRTLRDFYLYATPEQRERMERARQ